MFGVNRDLSKNYQSDYVADKERINEERNKDKAREENNQQTSSSNPLPSVSELAVNNARFQVLENIVTQHDDPPTDDSRTSTPSLGDYKKRITLERMRDGLYTREISIVSCKKG